MLDYIPLTAAAGRRLATAELRSLATQRMRELGYAYVANEFVPSDTGLRFDVIGIAKYTRQVRIYEVKSSRGDFLSDSKWERYLDYATHFSFVAPAGAIFRWELARGVGLIEYGANDPAVAAVARCRERSRLDRAARNGGARFALVGDRLCGSHVRRGRGNLRGGRGNARRGRGMLGGASL